MPKKFRLKIHKTVTARPCAAPRDDVKSTFREDDALLYTCAAGAVIHNTNGRRNPDGTDLKRQIFVNTHLSRT